MATFLDIGFLNYFSIIFVFLLVFFVIYAGLKFTKLLEGNEGMHAIIAMAIAGMFIVFKPARQVIETATPWFVILIFFLFFILLSIKFFGVSDSVIADAVTKGPNARMIIYWIITFAIIILLYSFSQVVGQDVGPYLDGSSSNQSNSGNIITDTAQSVRGSGDVGSGDFNQNLGATFFHPKVLGLVVILLIASFSIRLLSSKPG